MALSRPKPIDPKEWRYALELRLARRLVPRIRRHTPSGTLKKFLQAYVSGPASAKRGRRVVVVGVPHYWAVYYHDGTKAHGPRQKQWLVWFPQNPLADDPRLGGQWPVRLSEWRRLTKQEFADIVEINKEVYGRFSTPEFAVITKTTGAKQGTQFFDKGLRDSAAFSSGVIDKSFQRLVASYTINEKARVTVGGSRSP